MRKEGRKMELYMFKYSRYAQGGADGNQCSVLLLQNKGIMMGCSNPHPHGQVWSLSVVPTLPATELHNMAKYSLSSLSATLAPRGPLGRPCLLCEYTHYEIGVPRDASRVVYKNQHWLALVPWWATWPYETIRQWSAWHSLYRASH